MVNHFKPSTELSFDTVVANREGLFQYIRAKQTEEVCLDLSEVTHCDSAGLALLIDAKKLCRHYEKPFTLSGMSKKTRSLAEFCGVQALLD